ncbi:MAG: MFS transporter [Myxococcales bacterium]|nr:MFS transporter [Myxococcales bacterium]
MSAPTAATPAPPAPAPPDEERIPTGRILVYSSPVLGVFMSGMLISFYLLKFSTDVLLVGPAVMGAILLSARVWDAVSDPLVGWLSDRTRSRMGRRRPWFLASAVPFGLSVLMLWSPPADLEGGALTVWLAVAIFAFYTTYTMFRVPHMALGAELSRGYHDRTRVFGIMQAVESIGMLAAAGALMMLERSEDPRAFARLLAVVMGAAATVLIVGATLALRERADFQGRGGSNAWRSFGDVLGNPHSRILIGIFFLEQLGFSGLVVLLPYLSDYVLQTPGSTALYLFGAIGAALLSIPVWIAVSRRFGKKQVWLWSVVAKTLLFGALFFMGEGDLVLVVCITVGFGLMNGCGSVVGPSLKADVVDWDEARTGERKEGSYFAVWNFAQKGAGGIAVWVTGTMLALTGFVPNAVQSESTIFGMRLVAAVFPFVLHLGALALIARFALGEEEHRTARAEAEARLAREEPRT